MARNEAGVAQQIASHAFPCPHGGETDQRAAVSEDLLTIRDLSVEFRTMAGRVQAVNQLSLRVRPGSTVALVGESGSGKSVTAQAILGILPRTAWITGGKILFNDPAGRTRDLAALPRRAKEFNELRGNRIGMVFQEPMTSFSPLHTIGSQVGEALAIHRKVSAEEQRERVIEMLRLVEFPRPAEAVDTYPFELSGGLRQRAMVAMALICRPALLIADEPTTALDVTVQAQILKLIKDLQAELGMAVLLITHDLGVVANMAEEVVVVHHGKVVEAGTLRDVFLAPAHPYLKALLKAVPHFEIKPGERLKPIREIKAPAGGFLAPRACATGGTLIDVRHVSKRFGLRKHVHWLSAAPQATVLALSDVSFTIERGECLGLVGESGCGKTTMSKAIMRAVEMDSGEILFHDAGKTVDLLKLDRQQMEPIRRRIQYIFQDPYSSLDPRMTIGGILAEPFAIHGIGTDTTRRAAAVRLLEIVGLSAHHLNRYPHSFSGGQRQRIGIARALALQPDLVICDEPVSALDVSIQAQILNLLKDLQREIGLTYLFISHNLAVINYIADRIAVMCAGRIVEIAPRQALFASPLHPYTQALMAAVPYPDPDRSLNFFAIDLARQTKPKDWPEPFALHDGDEPPMLEAGPSHFVRARAVPAPATRSAVAVPARS
jgi:peptide/nickel transport system ATP-binding protein